MVDYINDTFIRLTDEGRIRDAVAFCERVAEEAPYPEFRCIALKNLAECHFFLTGDGEACREANLRGLRIMEENPELLEGTPHMNRELLRRMYSDFCEQFRSVAVSFEEYEEHCEKPLRVRQRNAVEKRGLRAVEELKSKNAGWKENMFILLDRYFPQSQWMSEEVPAAAQAACQAQLILLNRRKLRTQPLDVNFAMQQYMNCSEALAFNLVSKAEQNSYSPVADQITFVLDRAADLIESLRKDRQADQPTVETCLEKLRGAKQSIENNCVFEEAAAAKRGYLTLKDLEKGFAREMDALKDVNLTAVNVGPSSLTNGPVDKKTDRKLGRFFRILLFAVILFVFAWIIWKMTVYSFEH